MAHTSTAAGGPPRFDIYRSSTSVLNISLKLRTPNRRQRPADAILPTALLRNPTTPPRAIPQLMTAHTAPGNTAYTSAGPCNTADAISFHTISRGLLLEANRALASATMPQAVTEPRSSLLTASPSQPTASHATPAAGSPPTASDTGSGSGSLSPVMQQLQPPLHCMAAACVPGCVLLLMTVARGGARAPTNRVAAARASRARVCHVPRARAQPLPTPDGTGLAWASEASGGALAPQRSDPGPGQQQPVQRPVPPSLPTQQLLLLQPAASAASADKGAAATTSRIGARLQRQTNRGNHPNRDNRHRHVHAELAATWVHEDADAPNGAGGEGAEGQVKDTIAQLLAASNLLQPHELDAGVGTPGAGGRWEGSSCGYGGSGSSSVIWGGDVEAEEEASFGAPPGMVIGEDSCGRVLAWPPAVEVGGSGQDADGRNWEGRGGAGAGGSAKGSREGAAGSSVVLLLERGLVCGCGSVRVVVVRADGMHQEGSEEMEEQEEDGEEPRAVLDHTAYMPTGTASAHVEQQSDQEGSGGEGGSNGRGSSRGSSNGSWAGGGERCPWASLGLGAEDEAATEYVPIRCAWG